MSSQRLKISVAMCTFNGGAFVRPQLESILSQSRRPDEVIICDDGSTDNTIETVHRIASEWPATLHVIQNEKTLGFAKNYEKAIGLATGDVIFLSDQDDLWFEHKIATMSSPFLEGHRIGLVYSDAVLTDALLRPTGYTLFGRRKKLHLNGKRPAYQLVRGVGINGCTMAFRSSLKELVLPISEEWGHDHWIAFIAHAVMDVRPIDQSLMCYRRHGNSSGNDPFLEGGWIGEWKAGARATSFEVYAKDRRRWETMHDHLKRIAERALPSQGHLRLDEFIRECERRLELARLRESLKHVQRSKRTLPMLRSLSKGDYHRYLRGMRSFCKDLLVR